MESETPRQNSHKQIGNSRRGHFGIYQSLNEGQNCNYTGENDSDEYNSRDLRSMGMRPMEIVVGRKEVREERLEIGAE